eukprot:m.1256211 g.1256211  ORF g.1256211 m.1256211 type:complete len:56 (-) comp24710_c1_seq56:1867-2034(-)
MIHISTIPECLRDQSTSVILFSGNQQPSSSARLPTGTMSRSVRLTLDQCTDGGRA